MTQDVRLIDKGDYKLAVGRVAWGFWSAKKKETDTAFADFSLIGRKAEHLAKVEKGQRVFLMGELIQQSWTAKDGSARSKLFLKVTDFEFVEKKRDVVEEAVDGQKVEMDDYIPF